MGGAEQNGDKAMRTRDKSVMRLRKRLRKAEDRARGIPSLAVVDTSSAQYRMRLAYDLARGQHAAVVLALAEDKARRRLAAGRFEHRQAGKYRRVGELRDKLKKEERRRERGSR